MAAHHQGENMVTTGYRNINRTKQRKHETLSIGIPRGRSNPKILGYTGAAVFHSCTFFVRESTVQTIYTKQEKQVCAWFHGTWRETAEVRREGAYAIFADAVVPMVPPTCGREVTINPKSSNPTQRVFYFKDTGEPVNLTQTYTVTWVQNRCFVS
jgi:hypothetical protein